jgi:hypothetical protein
VAAAVATWNRRLLAALGLVTLAIFVDASIRGVLRALIDPADPGLRLLPYYVDIAAAVLFTQVLWTLLLAGAIFTGAAQDTTRRRSLRVGVAAIVLAALAISAAGPVRSGMTSSRVLDAPSRADLASLDRLERRVVPEGESFLVASRAPLPGGERWIVPADDAALFYLHARRPTLFLYFLDHTARYGAAGLEATCEALAAGVADTPITRHRARWALAVGSASQAVPAVRRRQFCGRRLGEWYPAMRAAGSDGRLTIVELRPDPR